MNFSIAAPASPPPTIFFASDSDTNRRISWVPFEKGFCSYIPTYENLDYAIQIEGMNITVFPSLPYLYLYKNRGVRIGSQKISSFEEGPHTGSISANHLKDFDVEVPVSFSTSFILDNSFSSFDPTQIMTSILWDCAFFILAIKLETLGSTLYYIANHSLPGLDVIGTKNEENID